jgi:hypothetical protein
MDKSINKSIRDESIAPENHTKLKYFERAQFAFKEGLRVAGDAVIHVVLHLVTKQLELAKCVSQGFKSHIDPEFFNKRNVLLESSADVLRGMGGTCTQKNRKQQNGIQKNAELKKKKRGANVSKPER